MTTILVYSNVFDEAANRNYHKLLTATPCYVLENATYAEVLDRKCNNTSPTAFGTQHTPAGIINSTVNPLCTKCGEYQMWNSTKCGAALVHSLPRPSADIHNNRCQCGDS